MQNLLFGVLIGYGAYWVLNTPKGKGVIRSTKTAVGQIEEKLNKTLAPKEAAETKEPLQIK